MAPRADQPKQPPAFTHARFAVLRTPLLPFDDFLHWSELAMATNVPSIDVLREFVGTPAFVEAIRVASPVLFKALTDWLAGREIRDEVRLEHSLVRYLSRATHRTTPFGLFAACSLLRIRSESKTS